MPKPKSKWRKRKRENLDLNCLESKSPVKENKKDKDEPDESFIDKLMKKADSLVDTFEYDLAKKFYTRVLDCDPEHYEATESLGFLYFQCLEVQEAEEYLLKAVSLKPDQGYRKYFALGQMKNGSDALVYFEKGIQVLDADPLKVGPSSSSSALRDDPELKNDLSCAYCFMAELYMTDLCDEDNAESQCKFYIDNAISVDESNPEAHQCLASFQLVKQEPEEAKKSMERSLSLWLPKYRESKEEENEMCPLTSTVRINCGKLLIELEMFDEASEVLEGLLEEDDEELQVLYLLGLLNYLNGSDYFDNSRYYFQKGIEVCKKLDLEEEYDDQVQHMQEILSEIGLDSDENKENENENTDDEEYETLSEEEEEMES